MALHAVIASIKLPCVIFIVTPSVPLCLLFDPHSVSGNGYYMRHFSLQSKLIDFISPLVAIKYKHVSFCYAVVNLVTIAATLV